MKELIKFRLKYIPDIFTDVAQEMARGFETELLKIGIGVEKTESSNELAATFDIYARKRLKELFVSERYQCNIFQLRNTEMFLLSCSEITEIEFESGEIWQISNVSSTIENESENVHNIKLTFEKNLISPYSYPLASENLRLKFYNGNFPCNLIRYTVKNPAYQYRVALNYTNAYISGGYTFRFPLDGLTDSLNVGDEFFPHIRGYKLNDYFSNYRVVVVNKTSDYVEFVDYSVFFEGTEVSDKGNISAVVTINNVQEISDGQTVADKIMTVDIYTAIHKKLRINESEGDKIPLTDNEIYTDRLNVIKYYEIPFFLKLDELWKYEYLKIANNIKYYELRDSSDYDITGFLITESDNSYNIAEIKDLDYFNQKEFVLNMPISTITHIINR